MNEAEKMFEYANGLNSSATSSGLISKPAPAANDTALADAMFEQANISPDQSGLEDREQAMYDAIDSGELEISPLETAVTAAADVATLGSLNKIKAFADTALQTITFSLGEGGVTEAWANNYDNAILSQKAIRYANPAWALGGDVAGGLVSGTLAAKGAIKGGQKLAEKGVPYVRSVFNSMNSSGIGGTFSRIMGASALAGAETTAYYINKEDGEIGKALINGSMAALGAGVITGGIGGVRAGYSQITGRSAPDTIRHNVGHQVMRVINLGQQQKGLPPLKPSEVAKMLEQDPTLSAVDAFPELLGEARRLITSSIDEAEQATNLYGLARTRADLLDDLMAPDSFLRPVIDTPQIVSPSMVEQMTKARNKALSPQYDKIKKDNAAVGFNIRKLKRELTDLFPAANRRTSDEDDALNAMLKSVDDAATRGGTKVPIVGTSKFKVQPATDLTFEQMMDLPSIAGKMLARAQGQVGDVGYQQGKDLKTVRALTLPKNYVTAKLGAVSGDYAALQKAYGDGSSMARSYDAGIDYIKGVNKDPARISAFLQNQAPGDADYVAFTEGIKYQLFNDTVAAAKADPNLSPLFGSYEGNLSPQAIKKVIVDNPIVIKKLTALFGPTEVEPLLDTMSKLVTKASTAEAITKAAKQAFAIKPEQANKILQSVIDIGITMSGSRGAQGGAIRRLAMNAATQGSKDVTAPTTIGAAQVSDEMLGKTGDDAAQSFQALQQLMNSVMSKPNAANLTAGVAGGVAAQRGVGNAQ